MKLSFFYFDQNFNFSSNESKKNDASQVVTEEDEDLMPSKLYMIRAEQDTDWQPSNSAVLKVWKFV